MIELASVVFLFTATGLFIKLKLASEPLEDNDIIRDGKLLGATLAASLLSVGGTFLALGSIAPTFGGWVPILLLANLLGILILPEFFFYFVSSDQDTLRRTSILRLNSILPRNFGTKVLGAVIVANFAIIACLAIGWELHIAGQAASHLMTGSTSFSNSFGASCVIGLGIAIYATRSSFKIIASTDLIQYAVAVLIFSFLLFRLFMADTINFVDISPLIQLNLTTPILVFVIPLILINLFGSTLNVNAWQALRSCTSRASARKVVRQAVLMLALPYSLVTVLVFLTLGTSDTTNTEVFSWFKLLGDHDSKVSSIIVLFGLIGLAMSTADSFIFSSYQAVSDHLIGAKTKPDIKHRKLADSIFLKYWAVIFCIFAVIFSGTLLHFRPDIFGSLQSIGSASFLLLGVTFFCFSGRQNLLTDNPKTYLLLALLFPTVFLVCIFLTMSGMSNLLPVVMLIATLVGFLLPIQYRR